MFFDHLNELYNLIESQIYISYVISKSHIVGVYKP